MSDNGLIMRELKHGLNRVGGVLPGRALTQIQAFVNYLKIGRWMRDRHFVFKGRVREKEDVWRAATSLVQDKKVLYLEFGVAKGRSISWWSQALKNPRAMLAGFDSFEGLPEDAGPWTKGQFAGDGKPPVIGDPRVHFYKGWFDQTLPTFVLPEHETLVVNMDADLYSSTIYVLRWLRPHFREGTFLYFDEMNHLDHEPRAFDEFCAESGLRFKPVCADKTLAFVLFACQGTP
jgi:hypothetical protein